MMMFDFLKDKTPAEKTGNTFRFRDNAVLRFNLLVIFLFTLGGIVIIGKAAIIMFIERDDWNRIKEKNIKYNVPIEAHRGNILDDNGGLIVSTLQQGQTRRGQGHQCPQGFNLGKRPQGTLHRT